jgi:hypothetical protein
MDFFTKGGKNETSIKPAVGLPGSFAFRIHPGCLYVFGGEAVSLIPGAGFIPNSLNNLDGMLRAPRREHG